MAKEVPNLNAPSPAPKEASAPTKSEGPTVSVPVSEWEALKEQLAVMQVQLLNLSKATPAPTAIPSDKMEKTIGKLEILPEPETPIPEGAQRVKFRVGLPHNREAVIVHDILPGQSVLSARDDVIRKYNKFYGIIRTEHQHQVMEEAAA